MPNPHYSPGDVVAYRELAILPATVNATVYVGMVVRELTSVEVEDLADVYSGLASPAFWVVQLGYGGGTSINAEVRQAGHPYQQNAINAVAGSGVITVIKASGDSDSVAGLLT